MKIIDKAGEVIRLILYSIATLIMFVWFVIVQKDYCQYCGSYDIDNKLHEGYGVRCNACGRMIG